MGEVTKDKKARRRRPRRPQYKHYPFATSITLYDPQVAPVPEHVLEKAEQYLTSLAQEYKLLVAVNRAIG